MTAIDYNYHTHTPRCHHAVGSEREYVEKAIEHGFTRLGFSDHSPQPFDNGYVSGIRMDMDELEGYVSVLKSLREEYRDRISIYIGLEAEYYPRYFDRLLDAAKGFDIDYMILGQHYLDNEEGRYVGSPTSSEDDLAGYVDEVIAGLETGVYTYLAHPDLIRYEGSFGIYEKHMTRLCEYAKDHNVPLELNALGFQTDRWYPRADFFALASAVGCRFVYGCDAHDPLMVQKPFEVEGMEEFIAGAGIEISDIEPLSIKNVDRL